MLCNLDPKFDDYVVGPHVWPDIPDDLLVELKKINEEIKKLVNTNEDYFKFPR